MLPTGNRAVTFRRLIPQVIKGSATRRTLIALDVLSHGHLLLVGNVQTHSCNRLLEHLRLSHSLKFHVSHWGNRSLREFVVVDGLAQRRTPIGLAKILLEQLQDEATAAFSRSSARPAG